MNVIETTKDVWFLDIPIGGVFECERIYYMKINNGDEVVAVGLECGEVYRFCEKSAVKRVRGSFVVE